MTSFMARDVVCIRAVASSARMIPAIRAIHHPALLITGAVYTVASVSRSHRIEKSFKADDVMGICRKEGAVWFLSLRTTLTSVSSVR